MRKAAPWIAILLVAGGLAAWYYLKQPAPETHPSVVELPKAEPEPPPPPEPRHPVEAIEAEAVPEEAAPLPPLAESDESVAEALLALFDSEALGAVLIREQVVSRMVTTVDSLDSRELAPLVMPVQPPSGTFQASDGEPLTISPDNFERYRPYVELVAEADVEAAVDFYRRHYPLFQQSYSELGYGDAYFNDRLVDTIDHLLATPQPEQPPVLVKPEAVYLYQDGALEALSAGQKILIRMGPEQAAVVREKLQELRAALTGESF
jgi:vacuolar-type H+-ATPase subunit F/Vma7